MFRLSRTSLTIARNASNPLKTADSLDVVLAFNINILRIALTYNLDSLTPLENGIPFMALPLRPGFEDFQSAKFSSEFSSTVKGVLMSFKAGYLMRSEKDDIWDFSLYTSMRLQNLGRFSFKIAALDFPSKWSYSLSWRLEL